MHTISKEKRYAVDARYVNFYTGGDVVWSNDGQLLYTLNNSAINEVHILSGLIKRSHKLFVDNEIDDTIYTFAVSSNNEYLVTVHRSSLIRLWHLNIGNVSKLWKSQHKGPVLKVIFSSDNRLICTSGSDSTIRIWDYERNCCLGALKDFIGPATLLQFHPNLSSRCELFAVGTDNSIYCWDYNEKNLKYTLRGHISQVSALTFPHKTWQTNDDNLISVGRDKVLIIWSLTNGTQLKVIPLYEELVGVFYISPEIVLVAGAKSTLKLINTESSKIISLLENVNEQQWETNQLLNNNFLKQLALITTEHNILIYDYGLLMENIESTNGTVKLIKQLSGFNDEILDICLLGVAERYLAMATNSKFIKLYDTTNAMDCKIISGHTDTVMTLSTPGSSDFLLSAGKDYTIIIWQLDVNSFNLNCIGKNVNSHTSTIGCVTFGCGLKYICASVCQSGSLKVWHIKENKQMQRHQSAVDEMAKGDGEGVGEGEGEKQMDVGENVSHHFIVKWAVVAHEKEIHSVTYSPNNQIIATASHDKMAKLWSANNATLIGILRGHSRGIWCVRFSPTDQIVLTTSSDCTIRIWSLISMTCLKRLEHSSTVLKAEFLPHGKYILATESSGLIKLWSVKTNECIQTLEEHDERVWSLAIPTHTTKYFFTGAGDSKLIKWRDITDTVQKEAIDKHHEQLLEEQSLENLIVENKNLAKAFKLALKLNKPKTSYKIMHQFVRQKDFNAIQNVIKQLDINGKHQLWNHVKIWNTNSRYTAVSTYILSELLLELFQERSRQDQKQQLGQQQEQQQEAQLQYALDVAKLIETMMPYVQRHFKRITELQKDLAFLEFILNNI